MSSAIGETAGLSPSPWTRFRNILAGYPSASIKKPHGLLVSVGSGDYSSNQRKLQPAALDHRTDCVYCCCAVCWDSTRPYALRAATNSSGGAGGA